MGLNCVYCGRFDTRIELRFFVEIMKVGKSHKFTVFMTNAFESMAMQTSGSTSQTYSTICH